MLYRDAARTQGSPGVRDLEAAAQEARRSSIKLIQENISSLTFFAFVASVIYNVSYFWYINPRLIYALRIEDYLVSALNFLPLILLLILSVANPLSIAVLHVLLLLIRPNINISARIDKVTNTRMRAVLQVLVYAGIVTLAGAIAWTVISLLPKRLELPILEKTSLGWIFVLLSVGFYSILICLIHLFGMAVSVLAAVFGKRAIERTDSLIQNIPLINISLLMAIVVAIGGFGVQQSLVELSLAVEAGNSSQSSSTTGGHGTTTHLTKVSSASASEMGKITAPGANALRYLEYGVIYYDSDSRRIAFRSYEGGVTVVYEIQDVRGLPTTYADVLSDLGIWLSEEVTVPAEKNFEDIQRLLRMPMAGVLWQRPTKASEGAAASK